MSETLASAKNAPRHIARSADSDGKGHRQISGERGINTLGRKEAQTFKRVHDSEFEQCHVEVLYRSR